MGIPRGGGASVRRAREGAWLQGVLSLRCQSFGWGFHQKGKEVAAGPVSAHAPPPLPCRQHLASQVSESCSYVHPTPDATPLGGDGQPSPAQPYCTNNGGPFSVLFAGPVLLGQAASFVAKTVR